MASMDLPFKEAKARLRARCLARRKALDPEKVRAGARAILQRLLALDEYAGAKRVHTYISGVDNEVDTGEFIRLCLEGDKAVVVPVVREGSRVLHHAQIQDLNQTRPGPFGLLQPPLDHPHWVEDLATIDLVVVPGLAFAPSGHRLGWGGGYYDRFLTQVQAPKVGLTYDCLLLREIPAEKFDMPVDIVLTESTLHRGGEP